MTAAELTVVNSGLGRIFVCPLSVRIFGPIFCACFLLIFFSKLLRNLVIKGSVVDYFGTFHRIFCYISFFSPGFPIPVCVGNSNQFFFITSYSRIRIFNPRFNFFYRPEYSSKLNMNSSIGSAAKL